MAKLETTLMKCNERLKIVDRSFINKINKNNYVWYACYGSNINFERFMYYIYGDKNEKFSTSKGCEDKSLPIECRQYIFKCPIYFAGNSKRWEGGGFAFLDYENEGYSYGKIYKLKMSQFIGVLEQEQKCKFYDTIILVDYMDDLPIFTFTAKHKLNNLLNQPSVKYIEVIKNGLLDLYDNLNKEDIEKYLKN